MTPTESSGAEPGKGARAAAGGSGTGAPETSRGIDVVILAGGTAERLGGASKPDVVVRGARMLDHVLAGLESLRGALPLRRVTVVAPDGVAVPAGVHRALEDPPLGGPVAGIAAGLAGDAASAGPAPLTALLTCDAPESWRALPLLAGALGSAGAGCPGACALDGDHAQYLLGLYRTRALARAVAPGGRGLRDVSVRRALGRLGVRAIDLGALSPAARDLDTWEELRSWDAAATGPAL